MVLHFFQAILAIVSFDFTIYVLDKNDTVFGPALQKLVFCLSFSQHKQRSLRRFYFRISEMDRHHNSIVRVLDNDFYIHVTCHSLCVCQCLLYLLPSGGDISPGTVRDAEIWGYYSSLGAYGNKKWGKKQLIYQYGRVKSAMLIRLYRNAMYVTNYAGYNTYRSYKGLFAYKHRGVLRNNIYLGLNRVIHNYKGSPHWGRTGRGLCSVCIYFQP